MSEWIDFKALRSQLKIEEVLKSYHVKLRIKGDRATGFCPLPGHKSGGEGKKRSPSFSVSLSRNLFQCFSCGAKGNVLDLGAYLEGLDPHATGELRKAALKLQERFGLTVESPPVTEGRQSNLEAPKSVATSATISPTLAEKSGDAIAASTAIINAPLDFELKHLDPKHPYLSSRGFTLETIDHFGLGFCAKGLMINRIAIPLHDAEGRLIGYAGRLVDDAKINADIPKYRLPGARERKGVTYEFHKSAFLYNGHRIKGPVHDLIVVEGFPSVWWLWQHGYTNVVALMGCSISVRQAELLIHLVDPGGRFWLMVDGDKPGEQCAANLFFDLAPYRLVRWVKLPQGQPTDYPLDNLTAMLPQVSDGQQSPAA